MYYCGYEDERLKVAEKSGTFEIMMGIWNEPSITESGRGYG
jgi:hypothetical protein